MSFSILEAAPARYDNQLVNCLDVIVVTPNGENIRDTTGSAEKLKTRAGDFFSQINFDCDLKLLSAEYDRIEPNITCEDEQLCIAIKVWPKPLIRSIRFEGNCQISTKDLRSELGVNACSPFCRQSFNKAFHKIQAYYIKCGYFESDITYEVEFDECSNQVDIQILICEGRSGKIKDIQFYNFTECEKEELSELMVTKRYILLTSWMSGEGVYHEEAIQHDKMVILNYLQNKGYADADVRIELCELPKINRIIIKIIADKGERFRIGKIGFQGNCLFDNNVIREVIGICSNDPYAPEDIHEAVQRLSKLYGRRGYIDTFVNFESKIRCDQNIYDIKFTIEEGEQYRVGLIKVIGNCVTQTHVILNETLLIPGQLFDADALCKTEERLRNIGYFKRVNVYAVRPEGANVLPGNYRNVHIEVEEDTTGNIGAFGGFSTMENLFVGLNITERNFNHCGLRSLLFGGGKGLRGGGEYAHGTISIGNRSRRGVISWTKPYFNDTLWSVGFDIEGSNNRYVSDDYNINSIGLTLHAMYDINAYVKSGVHYRLRYTHIQVCGDASYELRHEAKNSGLISAIGASWIYDSTNHPTCPTEGFKSKIEGECAGVGGKQSFLSFGYINSWYLPIGPLDPKGKLCFRSDFKFIMPYGHTSADEVPIEERFFLGGDETVRGFRPYVLGPKFSVDPFAEPVSADDKLKMHHHKIHTKKPRRFKEAKDKDGKPIKGADGQRIIIYYNDVNDDDPSGGLSLQYYSLEYSRLLNKRIEAFAFTDFGQLSTRRIAFGHLYGAWGFGARIKVVPSMPPVTIGMGFPVNAKDRSDVKRFFFTIGGRF